MSRLSGSHIRTASTPMTNGNGNGLSSLKESSLGGSGNIKVVVR